MAAHFRHLKIIRNKCRCRHLSTMGALEFERPTAMSVAIPVGFVKRRSAGCDGLTHKLDPTTSWARVNWKEVEGDLDILRKLASLMYMREPSSGSEERALSFLQRLTSPKDLIRIMSDGMDLSRDALPSRNALLQLPAKFFSEAERRAILLADGPLMEQRKVHDHEPLESEEEKRKRLNKPSPEQLQQILLTLADDLPNVFTRPMNFQIYHPNMVFENHIRNVRTEGVVPYIQQVALLRTVGHLKFAYVRFEVIKITKHPEDGTVRLRWRIRGMSGWKVLTAFWKYKVFRYKDMMKNQQELWYDGYSIFMVGGDGLIRKHIATNMMPDDDADKIDKKRGLGPALAALLGLEVAPRASIISNLADGVLSSSSSSDRHVSFSPLLRDDDPEPTDWSRLMLPLEKIR